MATTYTKISDNQVKMSVVCESCTETILTLDNINAAIADIDSQIAILQTKKSNFQELLATVESTLNA